MIETNKYARKAFYVDAIQVTEQNMLEVALWCQGEVRTTEKGNGNTEEKYIKVRVQRPLTERQSKAFVGDWVLYAGTGYKVYTPKAFASSFEDTGEAGVWHYPENYAPVVHPAEDDGSQMSEEAWAAANPGLKDDFEDPDKEDRPEFQPGGFKPGDSPFVQVAPGVSMSQEEPKPAISDEEADKLRERFRTQASAPVPEQSDGE